MIQEMEKLQAKGELGEEEMKAYEMDVTGRVSVTICLSFRTAPPYLLICFSRRYCWRHGVGQGLRWSKYSEMSAAFISHSMLSLIL
jgi:hypothetical protein